MIFSAVGVGVLLFEVAFFNEIVYLIGCIRLRDIQKLGKAADRRLVERMDYLNRKRLHCRKRALALAHKLKYSAEKFKLKLIVHFQKVILQHTELPFHCSRCLNYFNIF